MKRIRSSPITEENTQEFWFNTKTLQVEVGKQTLALYRIGPFKTRDEAERAYDILKARSQKWDEEEDSE